MSEEQNIPNKKSEDRSKNRELKSEQSSVKGQQQEKISQPEPQTSNMETHAHHLHKAPSDGWKHYLFEFLMLFLAVFCGFLAENWRENIVEHHRAKRYAQTMLEDLASDTTGLLDVIRKDKIVLSCFDSINATIQKGIKNNTVPGSFYYYCNIGTFSPNMVWNNATLTQIIQSGSLRYFGNSELVKELSLYYSNSVFLSGMNNGDVNYRDENIKLRNQVLNNYFYSLYSIYTIGHWLEVPDTLLRTRIPLQSNDAGLLNEFANSFQTRRRVLNLLVTRDYPYSLKTANGLIQLLKKEYHLK